MNNDPATIFVPQYLMSLGYGAVYHARRKWPKAACRRRGEPERE